MRIEFDYDSIPTVKEFSECSKRIRGLMGPFGSAKSSGCVMEIVQRSFAQEPGPDGVRRTRWAVVRNTYQQLKDTTEKTFFDWLPPTACGKWNMTSHDYRITCFKGVEIEVLFRALDRPEQVGNLLSLELTGAWFNEAREIPWAVVEAMDGRIGRYPAQKDGGCTWHGMILDTNPPDTDSRWYEYFEELKPGNAAIFKQPSGLADNAENLPNLVRGYYTNLAQGKKADYIKVYVKGEYGYVQDGKPIYPDYNDNIHCKEFEIHPSATIRRGWDFGLTPACTFSQLQPNGQWRVFDEIVSSKMGADKLSDLVLKHCNLNYEMYDFIDRGDPAGKSGAETDERSCFDILKAKGIDIETGDQSPAIRIECVTKPLTQMTDGEPAFLLHPRCKRLRKGFQGKYRFKRLQVSGERYSEKPDKNEYSHPHDALQYDATGIFKERMTVGKKDWGTKPKVNARYVI